MQTYLAIKLILILILNWTELDDDIIEFNDELPLTENWVFNLVNYIIDTIFLFWYCEVALTQFVLLIALYIRQSISQDGQKF